MRSVKSVCVWLGIATHSKTKCETAEETQEHILEHCKDKIRTDLGKVTTQDIFDDLEKLKITAEKSWKKLNAAPLTYGVSDLAYQGRHELN